MKKQMKKWVAMLLCIQMVLCCVPVMAQAEETSDSDENAAATYEAYAEGLQEETTGADSFSEDLTPDQKEELYTEMTGEGEEKLLAASETEEADYTLYGLEEWAAEFISMPVEYATSCQLDGSSSAVYYVASGDSVTVSSTGLVTPRTTTWYWYSGGFGSTYYYSNLECVAIKESYNFGTSVIRILDGGKSYDVTVEVCDYSDIYTDEVIDAYIAENFNDSMTLDEKLNAVCQLPASYNYSASYSSAKGMVISGGGDCWASTDLILEICDKIGLEAKARNGNRDAGAGSGHMNALVTAAEGEYYELEAGYSEQAPRYYSIKHRTSLFCYSVTSGGCKVYQYDGDLTEEDTLVVPETIDSYTVVAIGNKFIAGMSVKEVVLPETLTSIGDQAFSGCNTMKTLHIPAAVTSIGDIVFADCTSLENFTCSEENPSYTIKDGVLYDKEYTKVYYAPACSSVDLPETVECIGTYAFYYNGNIKEIVLPESVKTLEEGSIAACDSLEKVTVKGVETVDAFAFADCNGTEIYFESDPPTFDDYAFYYSKVSVYSPCDNEAWTEDIMQNYSGTVTWKKSHDGHVVIDEAVPATFTSNGKTEGSHCSYCGEVLTEQQTVAKVATVKLSAAKLTYTGAKQAAPKLIIQDSNGNTLTKGTDYEVTGLTSRKSVGRYQVKITLKGNYSDTKYLYYTIVPKAPTTAKAVLYGHDDVKFSWSKSTGATGYYVYCKKAGASSYTYLGRTTNTYYKKSNLTDGVKYTFKVVPYYENSSGTKYLGLTGKTATVYTLKKLSAPTVTKYSSTKVKVKWTNISGETGYQISVSTSKTGTKIVSTYATTSGTYRNITVTKGKTYYYKVRAYKVVDGVKIYGPWSNVKKFKLS